MHKFTFALLVSSLPFICLAQPLAEKTNIRLYEHHSSDVNQGMPFGISANGSQSGYDFVNHAYYNSFNPATMGKWTATEQANIDMVEHNGPFGGNSFASPFGFTAGTSTIWGGDIKGNNITVYSVAPASFDYSAATDVTDLKNVFLSSATQEVAGVLRNQVYIGKIRNTEMYVAIKITNVKNGSPNLNPGVDIASVYFDFDYKYGTFENTSVKSIAETEKAFSIYPNPSKGSFQLADIPQSLQRNNAMLRIMDMAGRTVYAQPLTSITVSQTMQPGNYFVSLSDGNNTYKSRLVIVE